MDNNKLIVFSDAHIGIYDSFSKPLKNHSLNDRSYASYAVVKHILDVAVEQEADVVCVGDLFDHRGSLDVRLINLVAELFKETADKLFKLGKKIYLLAGNHDQIDNSDKPINSLEYLSYLGLNIHVINTPQTIKTLYANFSFIPYSENTEMLKEWLKQRHPNNNGKPELLFAHVGIEGASDGGLYTHRLGGAFAVGDLQPQRYDYVMLGHYHARQVMAYQEDAPEEPKMWYVGSTSQKSFSDEGQEKGYDLFTFEDGEVSNEFEAIEPEDYEYSSKKFITLDMKDSSLTPEKVNSLIENNYTRVVTYSKDSAKDLQKVAKDTSSNVAITIKEEQKDQNRLGLSADSSESQIVSTYVDKYFDKSKEIKDLALQELIKASENRE